MRGRGPLLRELTHLAYAALTAGAALVLSSNAFAQKVDAEKEVVLAGYGGTLEQFVRDQIIPQFEKETGITVKLVVGTALSNFSRVVATRNNPEIDIYWSNELTHVAGKQQGLYDRLDPNIVTNLADTFEVAKDPDGIGVASYVIATGFQYNSKAFSDAGIPKPTSWNDLWDPRLKGRVALYSFNVAYSQDLLAILTRLAGGTEKDITPAIDKLKQLKAMGNLRYFAASPAELDNMLVQGQAWITVNGSPRGFILKDRGAPIDFAFPKEGAGFFTNSLEIVKGARHPKAAQLLVNFILSPAMQTRIATEMVAGPVNRKVPIPESLVGKVPSGEADLKKLIRIDRVEMNRQLDTWADLWNREIESGR